MNDIDYIDGMEKLLTDLHAELKPLRLDYDTHGYIQDLIDKYKRKALKLENKEDVDTKS